MKGRRMLFDRTYRTTPNAPRRDDGIVDDVAVERRIGGESIDLTGRELAAAILLCVKRGMTDKDTGRALGITHDAVLKTRERHSVPAATAPGDTVTPGTRSVVVDDRRPRRGGGGQRTFPMSQPLPLIYGTTNGYMGHRGKNARTSPGIVRWVA